MINVFLIGDSISLDYGQYLQGFVDVGIHVYGKPGAEEAYQDLDIPLGGNGGDSRMVLDYLKEAKDQDVTNCDYFFFNCGLHDVKHNAKTGQLQVSPEEYAANLQGILDLMQRKNVKTVFINSTPTDETRYGAIKSFYRLTADVPAYNEIARQIMQARNIPIIDLYAFTNALQLKGDALFRDHTHFTEPVIKLHAAFIAGQINAFVKTLPYDPAIETAP